MAINIICIYIDMHIHTCAKIHIHIHIYIMYMYILLIYLFSCVYIYVYISLSIYTYMCTYIYVNRHISMYPSIYLSIHLSIYGKYIIFGRNGMILQAFKSDLRFYAATWISRCGLLELQGPCRSSLANSQVRFTLQLKNGSLFKKRGLSGVLIRRLNVFLGHRCI